MLYKYLNIYVVSHISQLVKYFVLIILLQKIHNKMSIFFVMMHIITTGNIRTFYCYVQRTPTTLFFRGDLEFVEMERTAANSAQVERYNLQKTKIFFSKTKLK